MDKNKINEIMNTKIDYKKIWFSKKFILLLTMFFILMGSILLIIGMCTPVNGVSIGKVCDIEGITIF